MRSILGIEIPHTRLRNFNAITKKEHNKRPEEVQDHLNGAQATRRSRTTQNHAMPELKNELAETIQKHIRAITKYTYKTMVNTANM